MSTGNLPRVVSREDWLAARRELPAAEKELTRLRDRVNADRRRLPMGASGRVQRVGDEVFHTYSTYGRGIEVFHDGYRYLDLTALGRQEEWEEPQGRARPLGLQVGGPNMRVPDEYGDV